MSRVRLQQDHLYAVKRCRNDETVRVFSGRDALQRARRFIEGQRLYIAPLPADYNAVEQFVYTATPQPGVKLYEPMLLGSRR
jgi:hypothetical protein